MTANITRKRTAAPISSGEILRLSLVMLMDAQRRWSRQGSVHPLRRSRSEPQDLASAGCRSGVRVPSP